MFVRLAVWLVTEQMERILLEATMCRVIQMLRKEGWDGVSWCPKILLVVVVVVPKSRLWVKSMRYRYIKAEIDRCRGIERYM